MDLKQYLEDAAEKYPHIVTPKLARGGIVNKGSGYAYEVDNIGVFKQLGNFPTGAVPYGEIYRTLRHANGIRDLFNREGKKCGSKLVIPFSKVFNLRIGECLEKAILVQLAAQNARNSFLINGVLEQDSEIGAGYHAFNVVFNEGKPWLIDAHNPIIQNEKTIPYIIPLLSIEGKNGKIIVADEHRAQRGYYLC